MYYLELLAANILSMGSLNVDTSTCTSFLVSQILIYIFLNSDLQ